MSAMILEFPNLPKKKAFINHKSVEDQNLGSNYTTYDRCMGLLTFMFFLINLKGKIKPHGEIFFSIMAPCICHPTRKRRGTLRRGHNTHCFLFFYTKLLNWSPFKMIIY